jgi:hypothetical protein
VSAGATVKELSGLDAVTDLARSRFEADFDAVYDRAMKKMETSFNDILGKAKKEVLA